MSTLWNRSGTVERQGDDLRASGAKAFFYLGGTTTALSVYRDSPGFIAHTYPVVADANGRWPDVFIPFLTTFDVRVMSASGVQLSYTLGVPNPNPVDVNVTVPVVESVQVGMIHCEFFDAAQPGYVRLNGLTIGNASSSASERANADTVDLFTLLWNNLDNTVCPVSSGRGGSAASDFAANKTLGLPDMRGRTFVGLDDMGNSAAGRLNNAQFIHGDKTTVGSTLNLVDFREETDMVLTTITWFIKL